MTSQKVATVAEGATGAGTARPELDVTFTEQSPAHVEACERIAFGSLGGRAREKPIEIAAKIECVKLAARFRTPTSCGRWSKPEDRVGATATDGL